MKNSLALPLPSSCRGLDRLDPRWWCDTHRLEHLTATSLALRTDDHTGPVLFELHQLQLLEVLLDLGPFELMPLLSQALLQFLAKHQGQEAAEHMATDRIIALVEHRPGLQHRLHVPEDLLDLPELFVLQGHLLCGEIRVRLQDPFAIESSFIVDFVNINLSTIFAYLKIFSVSFVPNKALGSTLQLIPEGLHDGFSIPSILPGLGRVEAHGVAVAPHPHLLDLQRRRVLAGDSLSPDLPVPACSGQDFFLDFLHLAHPRPKDVWDLFRLQLSHRRSADHPPVRNEASAANREALADSFDDGQEGFDVGRVAGPHLAADGLAVLVKHSPDHHLVTIGTMILAMPFTAYMVASLTLKVDGCCIEKDQLEAREQVPVCKEQILFDEILGATGGEGGCSLLIGQFFPEEGHGTVEVVEHQPLDTLDPVPRVPQFTVTVRARSHQAVQHGEEHCPFYIEVEVAILESVSERSGYAGLLCARERTKSER